jgi:hypothetical protein
MLIVENWGSTYPDAVNHYWKLSDFSEDDGKNVLFAGWATVEHGDFYKNKYRHYENKMYFNTEQPCAFTSNNTKLIHVSADTEKYFNKIFTQDPFTGAWLNTIQKQDRFKYLFPSPLNKKCIVQERQEKKYDALYWGGLHGLPHLEILDTIKDYKYNFLSVGPAAWNYWKLDNPKENNKPDIKKYLPLLTHLNVPRVKMWELIRHTKVNVMANMLCVGDTEIRNVKNLMYYEHNQAFSHIGDYIMPQIKTRPFESAFNRCLMLVLKDPWNIQEDFFEPNDEFLYYEDSQQLRDILDDVKINWKNYEQIVENAFQKAMSHYTVESFIEQIKKECV